MKVLCFFLWYDVSVEFFTIVLVVLGEELIGYG